MNDMTQAAQTLLAKLGFRLTGPFAENNVRTALEFFRRRMPALSREQQFDFLRYMDLHHEVRTDWLPHHVQLAAFRYDGDSVAGVFYTKPGTSPHHLGIVPTRRRFHRYQTRYPVEVLVSRAASSVYVTRRDPLTDGTPWGLPGGGGGIQYIIPNAEHFLEEILSPVAPIAGRTPS